MKKLLILAFFFCGQLCLAQSTPVSLRGDVTVKRLMTVKMLATRIAKNPVDGHLYYMDLLGNIYRVNKQGSTYTDTVIYTAGDHTIYPTSANFPGPQCLEFHDSVLYVSGSMHAGDTVTFGKITKGVLQPNSTRIWSTVVITAPYRLSPGPFNNGLSGMIVSPAGDSITFCIGARTDHGELPREEPLTSRIYRVATNTTTTLLNDNSWLDASGHVYSRGIRNTYDLAYDANGTLFGAENSGERDHADELNRLQKGKHYGFPWKMGNIDNPQQFGSYDPSSDKLINPYSTGWRIGSFYNDPTFPSPPSGIFENPLQNAGPDADKMRDGATGKVQDAGEQGSKLGTFTPHSTPVGLLFDSRNILQSDLRGDGFMLRWNKGYNDSCGCRTTPDTAVGPFVDLAEDLLHLNFTDVNTLSTTKLVTGFANPVDAVMDSNRIYVVEFGYGTGGIYEVTLPSSAGVTENRNGKIVKCYPNPASTELTLELQEPLLEDASITLFSATGQIMKTLPLKKGAYIHGLSLDGMANGFYFYKVDISSGFMSGRFLIIH